MKYSLKKHLLTEASVEDGLDDSDFMRTLSNYVDKVETSYDSAYITIEGSDGCMAQANIAINNEDSNGGIWIDKIEVVKTDTEELHPDCFRKGYAKAMLKALTKAADETGTHLALIAASEAYYKRMYPEIDLPDKDELANLYMGYGFVEEYSNSALVKMNREPKSS